jgi:hypothetical protein
MEQASPDRVAAAADIEKATGSRRAPTRQGCHCSRMERGAAEKHLRLAHQGVAWRCRALGGSPGRHCSYAGAATGPGQTWVWRFSCRVGLVEGGWDPSLCPDWALQRRDWPVAAEQKPLSWGGGSMLQIPSFLVTRPRSTLHPCHARHSIALKLASSSPRRPASSVQIVRRPLFDLLDLLDSRLPRFSSLDTRLLSVTPWSLVAHKFSAHHGQMG